MRPLFLVILLASTASAQQQPPEKPGPVKKAIQGAADKAKSVGSDAFEQAKGIGGSLRRLALQIGSGVDTGQEVTDPFLPKGDDQRYAWDAHVLLRNDGTALQAKNTKLDNVKQAAIDWRLHFDPFRSADLDHPRDEVLHAFHQDSRNPKYGWGLGLSALKDDYWGYGVDFDKTKESDPDNADWTLTRQTTLAAGYSPLGKNDNKPWNASLVGSVYWTDVRAEYGGLHKAKNGPGFSVGPTYQLALDQRTRPFLERFDIDDKVKMDRWRVSLIYNGSSIGYANWKASTDVRFFLSKNLRITLGYEDTFYLSGRSHAKFLTGLSFFIHFIKITL